MSRGRAEIPAGESGVRIDRVDMAAAVTLEDPAGTRRVRFAVIVAGPIGYAAAVHVHERFVEQGFPGIGLRRIRVEDPFLTAGRTVECEHAIQRRAVVQRVIGKDGCDFER